MKSQDRATPRRDAAGRFVTKAPSRPAKRPAARRASLADLAERMRARLEQRLAADDETLFQGRDNGIALLLRLTELMDRIALMDTAANDDGETPDAADRVILERYVAWRLRRHGIAMNVEGVPPPEPIEGSDPDPA